ncbi:MAG: AAA family ATPase [Rhodococcus sp.]|nr:AAA family ATPase [Rhodococcus sp. (in: high G+C Gram-positive bacteria)]
MSVAIPTGQDQQDQEPAPTEVQIVTGAWLDAKEFPPLQWVVPGVIPEGLSLLCGAPKLGKSWMALGTALAIATGGVALGCIPVGKPRPVLYLALEDGHRRLQQRSRQLLGHGVKIPHRLHCVIKGTPAQLQVAMIDCLQEHKTQKPVVIVDTLAKIRPASSSSQSAYEADYRFVSGLKDIVDNITSASMILVHHTNKRGEGDFVDGVSGTQGIAGAADSTVVLRRTRNESGAVLSVTGRDVMEDEYAITSDNGTWTLDGGDLKAASAALVEKKQTENVGDRMTEVIKFVCARTETRSADLAEHLGIESNQARTYLSRAYDSGRIQRVRLGVYGGVAPVAPVADHLEYEPPATQATHATPSVHDNVRPFNTWRVAGTPTTGAPHD